jgi:hypothetical protein
MKATTGYGLLLVIAASIAASASESYKPADAEGAWVKNYLYLTGDTEARGAVFLGCNESESQHRVVAYIEGLAPQEEVSLMLRPEGSEDVFDLGAVTADDDGVATWREKVERCPGQPGQAALVGEGGEDILTGAIRVSHEKE